MSYFKLCLENKLDEALLLINTDKKKNAALRIFSYNGNRGRSTHARVKRRIIIYIDCTKSLDTSYNNHMSAIELVATNNHAEIHEE